MADLRLALMCGTDIPLTEFKLVLHQPRIKEIALMGERDFFTAVQCLNISKDFLRQDKMVLGDVNNFQIFMMIMQEAEAKEKKIAVQKLFSILFPNCTTLFTPRSFLIQTAEKTVTIDETNFEILQDILKDMFCMSNAKNQQAGFNPANSKAQEIAEKLMRGRKRVAEQNGQNNTSIFSQYLSILTVGLSSMSLQELMDLTMFQLYDLMERYQLYMSWDIDIRSRMAGAKIEQHPDNWMKNIH